MQIWPFRRKVNGSSAPALVDPSYIANGVTIEGNIVTPGELQIDGLVKGDVRAQTCIVDQLGAVQGRLLAEDVIVHGRVVGPIHGIRVQLISGAQVEGDIFNESVSIETGAHVDGAIRRCENPLNEAKKRLNGTNRPIANDVDVEISPPQNYRPLRAVTSR